MPRAVSFSGRRVDAGPYRIAQSQSGRNGDYAGPGSGGGADAANSC
jgi:hypothetical protein